MATTNSTASANQSATQSILQSLGTGSGVDTTNLVTSLVQAQFANRTAQLTSKASLLKAQVTAAGSLKSSITGFAAALSNLVKGGTLMTQPTSSNSNVLTASALGGANIASLSSTIRVDGIATAQGAVTGNFASKAASVGTGTLTLKFGTAEFDDDGAMTGFTTGTTAPVSIEITDADATLDKVAAKINAAKAGVTATVITNADGTAKLSIRGATGAAQAFTIDVAEGSTPGLSQLATGVDGATTVTTQAGNAALLVDGVAVERATNSIDDLVAGVKLNLIGPSDKAVTLTATRPTVALTNAVTDFVETYNQFASGLKAATDPITGDLRADTAAKTLRTSMSRITSVQLVTGAATGEPTTLGEIGIATNRDGTLKVDSATLTHALATWPDAVERLFADGGAASATTGKGIAAAMTAISEAAASTVFGLGASESSYTQAQSALGVQQDKLTDQSEAMTKRLTQQFSSMNARVSQYKSIQAFLTQQVDIWTKGD